MATILEKSDIEMPHDLNRADLMNNGNFHIINFSSSGMRVVEIFELAEVISNSLGVTPCWEAFISIAKLGLRVVFHSTSEILDEPVSLLKDGISENFIIRIMSGLDRDVERFLCAIQVGHYALHTQYGGIPKTWRMSGIEPSAEAEIFALAFLMPRQAFDQLSVDNAISDQWLAMHYGLPTAVIAKRRQLLNSAA